MYYVCVCVFFISIYFGYLNISMGERFWCQLAIKTQGIIKFDTVSCAIDLDAWWENKIANNGRSSTAFSFYAICIHKDSSENNLHGLLDVRFTNLNCICSLLNGRIVESTQFNST